MWTFSRTPDPPQNQPPSLSQSETPGAPTTSNRLEAMPSAAAQAPGAWVGQPSPTSQQASTSQQSMSRQEESSSQAHYTSLMDRPTGDIAPTAFEQVRLEAPQPSQQQMNRGPGGHVTFARSNGSSSFLQVSALSGDGAAGAPQHWLPLAVPAWRPGGSPSSSPSGAQYGAAIMAQNYHAGHAPAYPHGHGQMPAAGFSSTPFTGDQRSPGHGKSLIQCCPPS